MSELQHGYPTCDYIHPLGDAVAVGRFDPNGPSGYRARDVAEAPLRATRAEAIADACAARHAAEPRTCPECDSPHHYSREPGECRHHFA